MQKVIEKAFTQYGITEIKGTTQNNPFILKYFEDIGQEWVKNDETAWCAAFANWCLKNSGYEWQSKLNARSFLDLGWEPKEPKLGDVVILWRESKQSWKGHVGFFIRANDRYIYMLGGNQNNQVNIKAYDKNRLLGYRRLKEI